MKTMKAIKIIILFLLFGIANVNAQNNVGIGTTTPNAKAVLELQAIDKGFLAPRMSAVQMNAITTPPNGLLVYNTTVNCFNYWNSVTTTWVNMCASTGTTGVSNSGDTVIINLLKVDSAFITNLFATYIKADSAFIKNIISNYIKTDSAFIHLLRSDTAYIKTLITNTINAHYIVTDSINAGFGRFDSIYVNGQNLQQYISTLLSNKDTVVLKYLQTDSIQTLLIKADSAYIKNLLANTITATFIITDSIKAAFGRFDSLYVGGKNILQTISDSIKAQAWLLKGNTATTTNYLGTNNAQDLVFKTNGVENMRILNTNGNVGIGTTTPAFRLHVPAGYIGTDYINTTDNSVNTGVTGIMIKAGDNFLRTGTAAAINSFLGITAPGGDNLGNHFATTTLNMNANFITNAQGSSTFAQSNNTSTSFVDAPIQLREAQFGGAGFIAPRLSFHWAGVVASQIGIEASGRIAIRNNPGTGYENFVANETYANGWFRNINSNTGLYNETNFTGIYSPSVGVMAIFNNGVLGIKTITPTADLDVNGTVRVQSLPAGANNESIVTVDGAGNLHKKPAGFGGAIYVGTFYSGNTGAPPASPPVSGYFTSASAYNYSCAPVCRDVVTVNFPALPNTNYVVICTPVCNTCTTDFAADFSNEIRTPLIYQKTTTSFKLMVEETGNATQDLTWDIVIINY